MKCRVTVLKLSVGLPPPARSRPQPFAEDLTGSSWLGWHVCAFCWVNQRQQPRPLSAQPLWPVPSFPLGVDTDELDSNVDDWEEETIEFFVTEEIIPLGSQE